jgi:hypothetical protein
VAAAEDVQVLFAALKAFPRSVRISASVKNGPDWRSRVRRLEFRLGPESVVLTTLQRCSAPRTSKRSRVADEGDKHLAFRV